MTLAARLRRERTNAASKPNLTLYAPGNITLPYGKLNLTVGGRGQPGNAPVPGNIANYNSPVPGNLSGYNPVVPGNAKYNPPVQGNQAYNPPTGGNIANYNPPTLYGTGTFYASNPTYGPSYSTNNWSGTSAPSPGSYYDAPTGYYFSSSFSTDGSNPGTANYNPSTPGNAYYNYVAGNPIYNPPIPGNYAGTNPGTGGNYAGTYRPYLEGYSYTDYYDSTNGTHDYAVGDDPWSGYSKPPRRTYTANPGYPGYSVVNYTTSYTEPGSPYYNPYTPGNAYYNPSTPGTQAYNPSTPGTAVYNPVTPGTANYNPTTPGSAGTPTTVLGVPFPGGAVGTTAPLVADTKVVIPYQNAPVAVYVAPGGSTTLKGV